MNTTVKESVRILQSRYGGLTDMQVIIEIMMGRRAGDALFYLLFGRYQEMLHMIFLKEATPAMDFSDFMLELNMRLYNQEMAALNRFDLRKASFKTYLSKIAHNLLFDLRKKEHPTIDCPLEMLEAPADDGQKMMQLIDAINSYADKDARYVLFKVIEGYKSKEIAEMLTSRRHEDGTLNESETLKPSYIDTIRSRALRDIRSKMHKYEVHYNIAPCSSKEAAMPIESSHYYVCHERKSADSGYGNLFIDNLRILLDEMFIL